MKTGIVQTLIRLLCCALILFPHSALAGPVNIPGFRGSVVPRPLVPVAPASLAAGNRTLNIPGFYNRASLPAVPGNAVPIAIPGINSGLDTAKGDQGQGIGTTGDDTSGQVTVYQKDPNAVINWQSFNIGSNSSVHFDQKGNANWAALNRIWDANPSQIYGQLAADGKIYLINQNGILFGPGSRMNVNSLTASALNITNDDFLNNILQFRLDNYQGLSNLDPLAAVSNHGEIINVANGGYIFLMAPRVENFGVIDAPEGQIGLVAGTVVKLAPPGQDDLTRSGYYVIVGDDFINSPLSPDADFGRAINQENGKLHADGGTAGMYGNNVDQWGIIRSVTALQNKKGQVELRAANKITTGANSNIDLTLPSVADSLDPETGRIRTIDDTFDIQPIVDIKGLHYLDNNGLPQAGLERPLNRVELEGDILAPTGKVTVAAAERVCFGSGSSIDVSGVVTEGLPLPVLADIKLTSVELRDDYAQKDGVVQGEKITTSTTAGSAIGDLDQAILTRQRTAQERSIGGALRKADGSYTQQSGEVNITASNPDGDIIIKQGAVIDVSGGAVSYADGAVNSTKLLSGTKIYDISNAPLNLQYDKILGNYTKTHDRFGIQETYSGLYYGGASPLMTTVKGYTQGGDAGTLTLTAPTIVLDGQINAGVTRGQYQNTWTQDDDESLALSKAMGLEAPRAGTLNIGTSTPNTRNNPASISILSETEPREQLTADSPLLSRQPTVISAKTLNDARLESLNLAADLTINTEADAGLVLRPGGSFSATARQIDHQGTIEVPAGSISMSTVQNYTSEIPPKDVIASPVPLDEKITIGSDSRLDVSGEKIDNSRIGMTDSLRYGRTAGGSISIMDKTDNGAGVFIQTGAVVDVSGGYSIDRKGKVAGGNAGSLGIQGSTIELDGELRGHALADPNGKILGGAITLASTEVRVAPEAFTLPGVFVLAEDRLADTGFTQITLKSMTNVTVDKDTSIRPSLVRLDTPLLGQASSRSPVQAQGPTGAAVAGHPDLVRLDDSYASMAGPSSFSATAGVDFEGAAGEYVNNLKLSNNETATINISQGAVVQTTPAAKSLISLKAKGDIQIAGTLDSPGGKITLSSDFEDLTVQEGAEIIAAGYNRPDPASTPKGYDMNHQPIGAGSVALSAAGNLVLEAGSLIDISGSPEVENRMKTADGEIVTFQEAGDPGSLSLSYGDSLAWNGTVDVKTADREGMKGGSLVINRTDVNNGLQVRAQDVRQYQDLGFDDLTLKSRNSLLFGQDIDVTLGRKLTLDAPEIKTNAAGTDVALSAPWIVLTNTAQSPAALANSAVPTTGSFTLSGQWTDAAGAKHSGFIDVIGDIQFDGFKDVTLRTDRDIRLSQALYNNNVTGETVNNGMLATTGNLILDAERIYPGNYYSYKDGAKTTYPDIHSDYTVHANGKVTLLHTVQNAETAGDQPVYSAGGGLTVEGLGGIDVESGVTMAAPLGSIKLSAPGQQIYLAAGSTLTTAGSVEVNYGAINSSNIWVTEKKTNPDNLTSTAEYFTDDSLPRKGITLDADTTVAMDGSVIDVSGGGSVFAYKFLPGVEGSVDPLAKPNRYVAVKSEEFHLPGQAVYLEGASLSEGMYTLLPLDANNPQNARYAFMPGTYIIEAQSGAILPGDRSASKDGHPLAIGYSAVADTSIRGTRPQVYSVRTTDEVLKTEGNYVMGSFISGDGGNISIAGNAIVLDGALKGSALTEDYRGGAISLSGANIIVQSSSASLLPPTFAFGNSLPSELKGNLIMSGDTVKGFQEVNLGDVDPTRTGVTKSITAKEGAVLEADIISLAASGAGTNSAITIEGGAQLIATTGDGEINLATPGNLLVDKGSTVHASNNISLDVNNVRGLQGNLQVDNSSLTLQSTAIYFGPEGGTGAGDGLYLTQDTLDNKFKGFDEVTFASKTDIQFGDGFTLSASDSLTLDAARILDTNTNGSSQVTLNSSIVNLKNSGAASQKTSENTGTFIVNASDQINVGSGDVLFGGFKDVNLNSANDLTLKGTGSLKTGGANLNIKAARVTIGADSNSKKPYIAPNFVVDAGSGAIKLSGSGTHAGTSQVPGGLLEMNARRIELATLLQSDGGTLKLTTKGAADVNDDGIFLRGGGQILARGTDDAPGGNVSLTTDYVDASGTGQSGVISLDAGSRIDVSAGSQGDAGVITLKAPDGGVTMGGIIGGAAQGAGTGGSFILDTNSIGDIAALNDKLTTKTDDQGNVISGGFTESLDLRAKTGNIDITSGQTLQAHHVKLTADDASNGKITVSGTVEGTEGGSVELYATNDLTIQSGGIVKAAASAAGSDGSSVLLSSGQGWINADGAIDVSGGAGGGAGTIYLRAKRNSETGNDANIRILGAITDQSTVFAEAFWVYDNVAAIDATAIGNWQANTGLFMNNAATIKDNIIANGSSLSGFHLLPGIEVSNPGDIALSTNWDLTAWRDGGEPGVLTIRAGGNLNVNQNLVDHPTGRSGLVKSEVRESHDSWGFNLVAGADMTSADYLAVVKGKTDSQGNAAGDLKIANQRVVYTESAPIHFASGNDTVIGSGYAAGYMINSTMKYNLASYDGAIHGNVGRDLIINGGAIQTATGDIDIDAGRDLQLNTSGSLGAIRTTGRLSSTAAFGQDPLDPVLPEGTVKQDPPTPADKSTFYWRYVDGGDVTLDVGRSVGKWTSSSKTWDTAMSSAEWDYFSKMKVTLPTRPGQTMAPTAYYGQFSANYGGTIGGTQSGTVTAGLVTMGGGDLRIRTGGDFRAQAGTFGAGDLTIYSGGDIRGRFVNTKGQGTSGKEAPGKGEIHAMGNFGSVDERQQIELFNSQTAITALGEMQIGAIVNPDLASGDIASFRSNFVKCSYKQDSKISLKAGGDVTLAGNAPFYHSKNGSADSVTEIVLPATVSVDAGGDINLLNNFTLTSSPNGNLRLAAGGNISGSFKDSENKDVAASVMMSDIAPEYWYGFFNVRGTNEAGKLWTELRTTEINENRYSNNHGFYKEADADRQATTRPLHSADPTAVEIHASGDIKDVNLYFPKKAEVAAGGDIIDITYEGQNINPDDVSMIKAGGNISMKYVKDTGTATTNTNEALHKGLIQGGPGVFLVQAGGSIDLGTLQDGIQALGNGNNPMLGTDKSSLVVLSGYGFDKSAADIETFFSTIRTAGDSYAELMAAGKTDEADQLLDTTRNDTIIPFLGEPSGDGNINMTSSLISTSVGKSDVFIIANGDLNLGKTALPVSGAATKPTGITTGGGGGINVFTNQDVNVNESRIMTFYGGDITIWSDGGDINAGRGSRSAVSATPAKKILSPNGGYITVFTPPAVGSGIRAVTYGDNPPPPGNIHLFAPRGVIDAGEAGITGGRIILAALTVSNASNISFSAGSIGMPQASEGAASLGSLTGSGPSAQNTQLAADTSGLSAAKAQAAQMVDDIIAKWLEVKVIDFIEDEDSEEDR